VEGEGKKCRKGYKSPEVALSIHFKSYRTCQSIHTASNMQKSQVMRSCACPESLNRNVMATKRASMLSPMQPNPANRIMANPILTSVVLSAGQFSLLQSQSSSKSHRRSRPSAAAGIARCRSRHTSKAALPPQDVLHQSDGTLLFCMPPAPVRVPRRTPVTVLLRIGGGSRPKLLAHIAVFVHVAHPILNMLM
jgi:hypothetical protein